MLFDGEWRLPVNIFLAGQDSQQIFGVWKEEKKTKPTLYYLNKYFLIFLYKNIHGKCK